MNIIIAFLIVSWVFGSWIFGLFSGKQGYTHFDTYNLRMYGITPDRSNDADETVPFDDKSSLKEQEPEQSEQNN